MLTNYQLEEYRRFKTLKEWFALPPNFAIYTTYAPFAAEVGTYTANFAILDALVPNKDVVTEGITADKLALKHQGANTLAVIMDKTRAYALHYNFAALAAQMQTNAGDIFQTNDEDYQAYFISITNSINTTAMPDPNYAQYGVAAGDITAVLAIATSFNTLIGQAKNLASTATAANTDINAAIKTLRTSITQFDLLIGHFLQTNTDFVIQYNINSAVDNSPIRHTGIEGIIRDGATTNPLSGVTVKLLGTNKSAITDLMGHYSIIRVKTGDYQVECSYPGRTTQTHVFHIRRGHIEPFFLQFP